MTQIGNVYAQGLYSLAEEEKLEEAVLRELDTLQQVFEENPDFVKILTAPNLSKEERCRILDDSFRGKVQPYVLNYLKLMTEKGYMRHFTDSCRAFHRQYNEKHGILPVTAFTAVTMSDSQKQRLTEKLSQVTGKTIELECRIDPACIGGVRLDYDGRRVDGTVKNRLDSIGSLLQNTVL